MAAGAQTGTPPPGVTFGAPVAPAVTPPVAPSGGPPAGVTFGAPVQQPAAVSPTLTANTKNEGTYKMAGPDGSGDASIPYSNVPKAMQAGYGITDPAEQQRFMKDRNADPNTSTLKDLANVLIQQPAHALKESAKGLLKNEAQVPVTIAGWLDNMETHLNHMDEAVSGQKNPDPDEFHGAAQHVKDFLEAHAPGITNAPIGTAQERGATVGTMGEFAAGEAGLGQLTKTLPWLVEGGNYADKLKVVQPLLKAAAEHPRLAAVIQAGLESGTVGAGQAAVHGASPTEALTAGAETGGAAALVRGAGEGFAEAREAAAGRETAAAAHEAAPAVTAERTAAMNAERQATAQGQVKDVAQQATHDALDRLNAARTPTTVETPGASVAARPGASSIDEGIRGQQIRDQLGSAAATIPDRLLPARNPIVDEIGHRAALVPGRLWDEVGNPAPVSTTQAPTFEPVDAAAHAGQVNSFGDAAETLRTAADPVYKKIDTATGGQFAKLQTQRAAGYAAKDYAKVAESDDAIDELLRQKPKDVTPEDYAAAKSAWRDSKVLDRLHSATEGAFNNISEEQAARSGNPRLLKGGDGQAGALQKRIGSLLKKPSDQADVERVIGKEGVTNLYRASHLVSTPELRAQTQAIAEAVAKEFPAPAEEHPVARALKDSVVGGATGTILNYATGGHLPTAVGAAAGTALANGTRYVMRKMVMSPAVGAAMDYAVRNKVTPKVAAGMIAGLIRKEQPAQEEQPQ